MNATPLKGLLIKYKHFREIEPSNKTDFIMLCFAACRSMRELGATQPGHQTWLFAFIFIIQTLL